MTLYFLVLIFTNAVGDSIYVKVLAISPAAFKNFEDIADSA
jgi:hypothetical protein